VDLNLGSWAPLTEAQSRLNALASDRDNSATAVPLLYLADIPRCVDTSTPSISADFGIGALQHALSLVRLPLQHVVMHNCIEIGVYYAEIVGPFIALLPRAAILLFLPLLRKRRAGHRSSTLSKVSLCNTGAVQNGNLPGDAANSCSGDELDFDK
jgi:hypothetical protein